MPGNVQTDAALWQVLPMEPANDVLRDALSRENAPGVNRLARRAYGDCRLGPVRAFRMHWMHRREQSDETAAPLEARTERKRRLSKGPSEFREIRVDQPKPKR